MKSYRAALYLCSAIMVVFLLEGCDGITDNTTDLNPKSDELVMNESSDNRLNQKGKKDVKNYLRSAAFVIKDAVEKEDFRAEMHQAFNKVQKINNRYNAISFVEMESPKAFYKTSNVNIQSRGSDVSGEAIRSAFRKVENRTPGLNARGLRKFLIQDNASIYMPNIDIWDGKEIPTITWHPLDEEEEENIGFKPVESRSGDLRWEEVLVDEKYGETNPVLIVMPGESYSYEPYRTQSDCLIMYSNDPSLIEDPCYGDGGGGGGGGGGYTPPPPSSEYLADCEGTDCTEGMEVLMGYVELNHYPCGWLCSGRRIYFGQQFAYYNFIDSPITVTSKIEDQPSVWMKSGNRGSWVRYYSLMEPNWAPWQLSKPMNIWVGRGGDWRRILKGAFQVIEAKGDKEKILNIIYDTTLDMTPSDYQRDVFYMGALDRGNFKAGNTTAFGHETKEGYRVYRVDSGAGSYIRYTFPHRIYNY